MSAPVLINGRADAALSPHDRGLSYGDGLFETIRFTHGVAPLWPRHMQRLHEGCARLALPVPDVACLAAEAVQLLPPDGEAVVRITLTRGPGERGYAPAPAAAGTRLVSAHPLPAVPADWYVRGIRVRSCGLQLAAQPRLAGIKHLNRLEQVLARAEWSDPGLAEGLLFDAHGNLVSATAANVFGVLDGRWVTPALDACGVAGVMRAELLEKFVDCAVAVVSKDALMAMDEIFLCSSVRGVLPVRELDGQAFAVGAAARAAQAHWRALGFAGATA